MIVWRTCSCNHYWCLDTHIEIAYSFFTPSLNEPCQRITVSVFVRPNCYGSGSRLDVLTTMSTPAALVTRICCPAGDAFKHRFKSIPRLRASHCFCTRLPSHISTWTGQYSCVKSDVYYTRIPPYLLSNSRLLSFKPVAMSYKNTATSSLPRHPGYIAFILTVSFILLNSNAL